MRKLSKSEAGKLGSAKSKEANALKKKERIKQYMEDPKHCKQCKETLNYDSRSKKFCNSSCSAKYNNRLRKKTKSETTWYCANCGKDHTTYKWKVGKYCNTKCQQEFQRSERIRQWLEEGKDWNLQIPRWVKHFLAEQNGDYCSICGIKEWNGKSIALECDHVDGNHKNNRPENLRLLCPNCHSQTVTYKAKNIGNGREYRRTQK